MAMYCDNCGARVPTIAEFCSQCGHDLDHQRQTLRQGMRARRRSWGRKEVIGLTIFGVLALSAVLAQQDDRRTPEPEQAQSAARATVQGTVAPSPTPSVAEIRAAYPPLDDVRELIIRTGEYEGRKVTFPATIATIRVAQAGYGYELGNPDSGFLGFGSDTKLFRTVIQANVHAPDGSRELVVVGYDDDVRGLYEGDDITVYGTVEGQHVGRNAFGGRVRHPLIVAQTVEPAATVVETREEGMGSDE